jgi:pimeloyl-ACP methyl ester carboxylesterase
VVGGYSAVNITTELGKHYRVYAPDLPGYARSSKPDRMLTLAEQADVLAANLSGQLRPVVYALRCALVQADVGQKGPQGRLDCRRILPRHEAPVEGGRLRNDGLAIALEADDGRVT